MAVGDRLPSPSQFGVVQVRTPESEKFGKENDMWLTCPDCNQKFFLEMKYIIMLQESIIRNPKLKIICSSCGYVVLKKYYGRIET